MNKIYQKHGYATKGISATYIRWYAMIDRCHNPNNFSYKYYGGRGITVCHRWRKSIKNFVEDMGSAPFGKTLDRINNNGPYSKSNCRWASKKEQRANQRPNRRTSYVTVKGKLYSLKEWSKKSGIKYGTLYARIFRYNYSNKEAIK